MQHQVENTAATRENLEDGYPSGGDLWSDPALEGPGTRKTSLNKKVAAVTPLPSPRQRRFRDGNSQIPSFYLVNLPLSNMTKKRMLTYVNCILYCSPGMHRETSSYRTEKAVHL